MCRDEIDVDLLPFIPDFQYELLEEKEMVNSYVNSESTIVTIGPSGMGKTSFIIRRLGLNPGIFITCSSNSYDRGRDRAACSLYSKISNMSTLELYASCRQLVQCNFISRLIYAHYCLDLWEKTQDRGPFKNPLQMNAFTQWNRNSTITQLIFDHIVDELGWNVMEISSLRNFTRFLIDSYYERLNISNREPFVIAIDEVSIFSSVNTPLLSYQGTSRDLLNVITSEINELRMSDNLKISDIYCGENFTISNSPAILQSSIGKGKDICRSTEMIELDLIPFDVALDMVDQIVNVEELLQSQRKTKESLRRSISHIFPIRRGVIGMVLKEHKLLLNDIERRFIYAWKELERISKNSLKN